MQDYLNWTRHPVAWFKQAHDHDEMVIRPPFQRNPVWREPQKAYLIDSILRGFPIPEVYLQEVIDPDGKATITVVDGQQRIRACLEFIEGEFTLDAEKSPEWGDVTFDELAEDIKKRIYNYAFVVRLMPDVPEESLRKIFARLNQNVVALNKQELRHATYWGEFITTMEEISTWDFWGWTGVFTANDVRRMLDVEFISELAIAQLHGPQNKKRSLDKFYALYEEQGFEDKAVVLKTFQRVTAELEGLLPALRATRWRKKSDLYTLFLVFAQLEEQLPFSKNAREDFSALLKDFSTRVDLFQRGQPEAEQMIRDYADDVGRAASDLSNRKSRQSKLVEWLGKSDHWP